jgi:glutamate decarboxylase
MRDRMLNKKILQYYNFPQRALRNLGTFNTSYMDTTAKEIFFHYVGVNAVDSHAYPELDFIKAQCAEFLLNLFHAKNNEHFRYFTASGSSESILLAMLVLKKQHQKLSPLRAYRPNIIIGENSHIAWYKAARYLNIELRVSALNRTTLTIDNDKAVTLIDDNTIGICCTLGAPTTLLCDNVFDMNSKLMQHFQATGQFIAIHVDAAIGGFIIPFMHPHLKFDFSLPHVFSINVSSHKYGLIYPSLGWLFLRNASCLDEMLDESDYLGSSIKQFSIQFSHSASHLMTQYYYIQTLGKLGYQRIMNQLLDYTEKLKQMLIHKQENIQFIENTGATLPGLVFTITNTEMDILSKELREKNWYLPVYSLPNSALQVARIVVRHGYNSSLIDELSSDIVTAQAVTN